MLRKASQISLVADYRSLGLTQSLCCATGCAGNGAWAARTCRAASTAAVCTPRGWHHAPATRHGQWRRIRHPRGRSWHHQRDGLARPHRAPAPGTNRLQPAGDGLHACLPISSREPRSRQTCRHKGGNSHYSMRTIWPRSQTSLERRPLVDGILAEISTPTAFAGGDSSSPSRVA